MIVEFDRSFYKSLVKVNNHSVLLRIKKIILELEASEDLIKTRNLKKLSGHKSYYRIRIGDYRLGFEQLNRKAIRMLVIAHRKNIYRKFP